MRALGWVFVAVLLVGAIAASLLIHAPLWLESVVMLFVGFGIMRAGMGLFPRRRR